MPMRIQKQIEIAASAATVWRLIGTEEGLRQWWGLALTLEAKSGGRCEETIQWQGRRCLLRGKVTAYEPPHKLALFLQNADDAVGEPTWMTITITLAERNGCTLVTLVQEAFSQVAIGAVSGLVGAAHTPLVGGLGSRQQPQNFLMPSVAGNHSPTPVNGWANPAIDNQWLAQQEIHWPDRLQTLAQQVLLTLKPPTG